MTEIMNKGAVAVFVKTISYSPLKTRLASGIGTDLAMEFYRNACLCIEEQLKSEQVFSRFKPFWAVAEAEAMASPEWSGLSTIAQGHGSLGERLDTIYSQLISRFPYVALMGADSPQINGHHFAEALSLLEQAEFVIGPAEDGGFYLFLGRKPIPKELWLSISYSCQDTADQLIKRLQELGRVRMIQCLVDVDTSADLDSLYNDLSKQEQLAPSQRNLLSWIHQYRDQWPEG